MLHSLKISNVALIEEVNIEFQEGLNVLTGETGAGKSILVDSLGVVLGERTSSDLIRSGADELKVEGVFSIPLGNPQLLELLQELDLGSGEEEELILTRKINRSGKNTVWINGWQVPVSTLKKVGSELVQIHAQYDTQEIFSPSYALLTFDSGFSEIQEQKKVYQKVFEQWRNLLAQRGELASADSKREERLELISWQLEELSEAHLTIGEKEELNAYIQVASNSEKISDALSAVYQSLSSDDCSALAQLSKGIKEVQAVSRYEEKFTVFQKELEESYYRVEEVAMAVRDYQGTLEFDPFELEEKQKRTEKIYRLEKKYGLSVEELIEKQEELGLEKEMLEQLEFRKEDLEKEIEESFFRVQEEAEKLRQTRLEKKDCWEKEVEDAIRDLSMENARFSLQVAPTSEYSESGADTIDFLFSANLGQPLQSLKKVASGGELSRIALVIQSMSRGFANEKTMIFDEIDAGIGGKTALAVGRKMKELSLQNQILSITHLPQIAIFADEQLVIKKMVADAQTFTQVEVLAETDRVSEIARMISGAEEQKSAQEMASEMLRYAQNKQS